MSPNHDLRTARESLNLSIQEVADKARVSFRTVQRAEKGYPLNPGSRQNLCDFFAQFGISAKDLHLVPQRRQSQIDQSSANSHRVSETATQEMLTAMHNLEQEGIDMNRSRRFFLQTLGAAGITLTVATKSSSHIVLRNGQTPTMEISASTIENMAVMTQQYRFLQLAGFATEDGLRSHISLVQNTLENTINDKYRRELWRLLAQSQILARHSITKKQELGRARTWNEAAIASAQYSGDAPLLGASIGHLSHLYLTWQDDPLTARKILSQAQEYTHNHPVDGWLTMVAAAISAKEQRGEECESMSASATETAHAMPKTAEYTDLFYTDFNVAGTDAFTGNCLLKVGKPTKALERLTAINFETLAENRHASAFHDIACAHAATGELEAMQAYAFRSIDKALATNRLYIVPRFITLVQNIQAKDPHEPHAASIAEYAHVALHE